MRIKLPRLLDASMKEKARLHPVEPLEIELNADPPSTAKLTIGKTDPPVKIRDWIELYTKDGSAGIYRVTGVEESYDGEQVWITLEHGIVALGDAVIIGEGTFTGSLGGLMSQLLSHQVTKANGQPLWRVGNTVTTKSVRRDYQNPNLLSELIALLGQAGDVMLTFDQSALPWVVNLVALNENDLCEGRFGRNLQSLTVSVDDNDLCTRVIVDGTGKAVDADTISKYGVVARVLNVSEYATEESADQYIAEYLEANKEPNVSIDISAVDMSETTGESIDSFRLGRMCRACLPDHGLTVKRRIVSLRIPDVYGDPQGVHVSLGKKQPTFTDLLMQEQEQTASTSSRVSRGYGSAMTAIESNVIRLEKSETTLEDTRLRMSYAGIVIDGDAATVDLLAKATTLEDTRQRMSAAGINIDGDASNVKAFAYLETVAGQERRLSSAELILNGAEGKAGLVAQVEDQEGRLSSAELILNGDTASGGLVARVKDAEDTLDDITGSALWATRDSVTGLVGKFTINSAGDVVVNKGTGFLIQRDSGTFGVYDSGNLTAGVMVQKINDDTSVTISADRVNLEGYVTVSELNAVSAKITNLVNGSTTAQILKAGEIHALSADFSSLDTSAFYIGGVGMTQHTQKIYKGGKITVSGTTNYTVYDTAGNPIGSVRGIPSGWAFTQYSDGEFVYLGPS